MADWWSYGVILYEMISGYTPFGSAAEDDTDVFRDILHTKIRSGTRLILFNLIINGNTCGAGTPGLSAGTASG